MTDSAIYTYLPQESTIEYEGTLSLLLFTAGCNFTCRYCHNPELIPPKKTSLSLDNLSQILSHAKENWVDGISISGGEPTLHKDILPTLQLIKSFGFKIKLDTQGSYPEVLESLLPYLDYIAMDYKMPLNRYQELIMVPWELDSITRSLALIKESHCSYEIRTTVVPFLHSPSDIIQICQEIRPVDRFVLQTFIPRDNLPDSFYRNLARTPFSLLEEYKTLCTPYIENVILR